eukprot:7271752-Pyramimonas_sp.AAC.1
MFEATALEEHPSKDDVREMSLMGAPANQLLGHLLWRSTPPRHLQGTSFGGFGGAPLQTISRAPHLDGHPSKPSPGQLIWRSIPPN